MDNTEAVALLRDKYVALTPVMDERTRRLWAATEAQALGCGGHTVVAHATGMARRTIASGLRELPQAADGVPVIRRLRRAGGGRKPRTVHDPPLVEALLALVAPTSRGDPAAPVRWTCKRVRHLAAELHRQGHPGGRQKGATLLADLRYSRRANRKTKEGAAQPDRKAQLAYINAQAQAFPQRGQPVIAVDPKKQELVGDFKHGGRDWRPPGEPEEVRVHDVVDKDPGKAIPSGVSDLSATTGWVSGGCDHDTAAFAVESRRRWWDHMGAAVYPQATELRMTAAGGGSHSSRSRVGKVALHRLADERGLQISGCHFPPGTSTWNKIDHRLFRHLSLNGRGRPLTSHEVIVNLIANTTTQQQGVAPVSAGDI